MAGRRAGAGLALAAVALSAAGCGLGGSTKTVTKTVTRTVTTTRTVTQAAISQCTGSQLSGTFALVPGSAGAGQISYALTFTNTSSSSCTFFSGLAFAKLLSATGSPLPTDILAPTGSTTLSAGASIVADARFSPSVPGTGDSASGACQPKAHTLEMTPGEPPSGGPVDVPITPPTSVCERGSLTFDAFAKP